MKNVLKKSLAISLSLVGAMIGVGLASGREIVSFYAKYGFVSLLFCIASGFIFYILIYVSMKLNSDLINMHKNKNRKNDKHDIKNNQSVRICNKKYVKFSIYNIILYVCQIGICSAMFAGLYSIFTSFGLNVYVKIFLLLIVYFVSILILKSGNRMVFSLNFILSIFLIFFCVILLIVKILIGKFDLLFGDDFAFYAPLKSILYAGMNVLTIYPLICEKAKFVKSKKEISLISLFSSFFIVSILIVVCLCILFFGGGFVNDDMIMLSISSSVSNVLYVFHVCLILFSVFSTLLSTAYGACKCIHALNGSYVLNLTICLLLSFVGFSNLIDYFYPVLGVLFIVYICVIHVKANGFIINFRAVKHTKKRKNVCDICEKRA